MFDKVRNATLMTRFMTGANAYEATDRYRVRIRQRLDQHT
jgi:hypothetical protein